ncbi:hypothetical protein [Bacillus mycoides]|nr:hypothetical protein [Bacillus mycoides]
MYFGRYKKRMTVGGLDEWMEVEKFGDRKLLEKGDLVSKIIEEMFGNV